jgi:hypothetical protein
MMNDSYPKDHPGCLSKAREVLQQAMRDTDVQNVAFLEFQEEVTQVLVFCAVCQQLIASAVMHTCIVTCCRLWLCISALLSVASHSCCATSIVMFLWCALQHTLGLPLGCTGHPSVAVHEVMAEHLTKAVRNITGW